MGRAVGSAPLERGEEKGADDSDSSLHDSSLRDSRGDRATRNLWSALSSALTRRTIRTNLFSDTAGLMGLLILFP